MEKSRRTPLMSCASCELEVGKRICYTEEGAGSKGCATLTARQVLIEAGKEYDVQDIREFARQASIQEAEGYGNRHQRPYIMQPTKTRMVEICEFAKKVGYKCMGLAFCIGMVKEAGAVEDILQAHGFEVVSMVCKAGRISRLPLLFWRSKTA